MAYTSCSLDEGRRALKDLAKTWEIPCWSSIHSAPLFKCCGVKGKIVPIG